MSWNQFVFARRIALCVCWGAFAATWKQATHPVAAQAAYVPHLAFDVASIRESGEGNVISIDNVPKSSLFLGRRVSVRSLLMTAYDVKIWKQLENLPEWAESIRLDVMAKSDAATDEALAKLKEDDFDAEKRHMLQQLLAERFHLQIHTETRQATTYELAATRRSLERMTPVEGSGSKTISTCNVRFSAKGREIDSAGCPLSIPLMYLRGELGAAVEDRTGLSGLYAFHLMWSGSSLRAQETEDRYPRLQDAVREQMGLELKPVKGPVTFWVVDHVERPTQN